VESDGDCAFCFEAFDGGVGMSLRLIITVIYIVIMIVLTIINNEWGV